MGVCDKPVELGAKPKVLGGRGIPRPFPFNNMGSLLFAQRQVPSFERQLLGYGFDTVLRDL
jgi:hypothetical protein